MTVDATSTNTALLTTNPTKRCFVVWHCRTGLGFLKNTSAGLYIRCMSGKNLFGSFNFIIKLDKKKGGFTK